MKNEILQEELKAFMDLHLDQILDFSSVNEQDSKELIANMYLLSWELFLATDGKQLTNSELEEIVEFEKKKEHKKIVEYVIKKFPDLKSMILKNVLLAKKLMIIEILKGNLNVVDGEEKVKIEKMIESAENDHWKEFISFLKKDGTRK